LDAFKNISKKKKKDYKPPVKIDELIMKKAAEVGGDV
jgi:hypothetical protein